MTFKVIPRERLLTNNQLSHAEQENVWVIYRRFERVLEGVPVEDVLDALMQAYIEGRDRTYCALEQNP